MPLTLIFIVDGASEWSYEANMALNHASMLQRLRQADHPDHGCWVSVRKDFTSFRLRDWKVIDALDFNIFVIEQ
jgi:hypothetical protein